jgi:heme-degrading monooxygenase HmoA
MNLKPNSETDFTRILESDVIPLLRKQKGFRDELTVLSPDGREAVGISVWDGKEHAEAYNRQAYPDVLRALERVTEGPPQVKTYEVANSTFHKIAARVAA